MYCMRKLPAGRYNLVTVSSGTLISEAYSEGDQRHLSAESGLYARIFTEGMFGVKPTGLNSFICTPRLPGGWDSMSLKNMHVFGKAIDLEVQRKTGQQLEINVITST